MLRTLSFVFCVTSAALEWTVGVFIPVAASSVWCQFASSRENFPAFEQWALPFAGNHGFPIGIAVAGASVALAFIGLRESWTLNSLLACATGLVLYMLWTAVVVYGVWLPNQ